MDGMAVAAALAPATGLQTNNGFIGSQNTSFTPKELNDFRISAVIDRLKIHLYNNSTNNNEFENLCLSLSRGIDFSIANHQVPNRSTELPSLIKQVCHIKNDTSMQASIMVLMFSIKSACQNKWFPDQDSEELNNLTKKIASNFCSASDFNSEPNPSHSVISTIMSRFYPRLRMGHIFVFLEVKPGFDAYVSDFQISKNLKCSQGDRIRLFTVHTNNIETSSCLVAPAKVNFLLNGKGVDRRTTLFMDSGPQAPTIVTSLLKYGSNLFQAVGEFNGNYIMIVAFMREMPSPDSSTLKNYEQHAPATVDADSEVIEGQSRIALNCPISFKRIKTPVKGLSCKHIQCFDFDNYVDMNSRRPSWRCPHCNQHVCFSELRIDQKMVQVLKEVRPNVSDIIVSSDGSWNAATESEETTEKSEDNTSNTGHDEASQPADILDLTQTDDLMDIVGGFETEDRKHSSPITMNTHLANTNDVNQSRTHIGIDSWAGIYMSTFGAASSNVQTTGSSASTSNVTESFTSPIREVGASHHNADATTSAPQTGTSSLNPLQYQLYPQGYSHVTSDYGRSSQVPRHITRTASAVQALPAQIPTSILQRSSSANASTPFTTNGLSAASQASPAAPNLTTNRASPHQVPPISPSTASHQHSSTQQNRLFASARPSQQNTGFVDPNQVSNLYRASNENQSSSQPTNFRIPRSASQSSGVIQASMQSPTSLLHPQSHPGVSQERTVHRTAVASTPQSQLLASANRAAQMSVGASRSVPSYPWNPDAPILPPPMGDQRGTNRSTPPPQPVIRTDVQSSTDVNWRPAARMRGALTGQAYDEALNRFITQPSQQQAARPILNATPLPNTVRANLAAFVAGGTMPAPNSASAAPVGRPAGSDILPDASS